VPRPSLEIRSALAGIALPGHHGKGGSAGATLSELTDLAMVSIAARGTHASALSAAIEREFGTALPMLPARHARDRFAVIWSGCDHWLAIGPMADGIAARLASCAGELGSVTDLTGAYTIVRIAGPRARDGMMKLVPTDLDASVFTAGSAAATVAAHIPVQLWPVQLWQTDQSPTYEISCPRSYAASLWRTLSAAFAEYGYDVSAAR